MEINEKDLGKKAARTLQQDIRSKAGSVFNRVNGDITKMKVTHQMHKGGFELKRLIIKGERHPFVLNYGFNGSRRIVRKGKNYGNSSVFQIVKGIGWLNEAVENSLALEQLADGIGEARMEKVIAQIRF